MGFSQPQNIGDDNMDTLSVSDLSINEQQLLAFNEYMVKTDKA